jgi:hypothetical protein
MLFTINKNGLLDSLNGKPSFIDTEGNQYYHNNGKLGRSDKPSIIMANGDKYWYLNGIIDRENRELPCVDYANNNKKYRLENGYKLVEKCYDNYLNLDNILHNEDGPSIIRYNRLNNNIESVFYYKNGKQHRENKYAVKHYHENGIVRHIRYMINGKAHRENGPAKFYFDKDGSLLCKEYWINGNLCDKNGKKLDNSLIYFRL